MTCGRSLFYGIDLGLLSPLLLSVTGRLVMRQDLLQRAPAETILLAGATLAQLLSQHLPADFSPKLHVGSHSRASLRRPKCSGLTPRSLRLPGLHICALPISTAATRPKRCRFRAPSTTSSPAVGKPDIVKFVVKYLSYTKDQNTMENIIMTLEKFNLILISFFFLLQKKLFFF